MHLYLLGVFSVSELSDAQKQGKDVDRSSIITRHLYVQLTFSQRLYKYIIVKMPRNHTHSSSLTTS